VDKSRRRIGFSLVAIDTFSIATYILPFRLKIAQAISGAFKFVPPRIPDSGIDGNRSGAAGRVRAITGNRSAAAAGRGKGGAQTPHEKTTDPLKTTALVPKYQKFMRHSGKFKILFEKKKVWGLTVNKHPTLWFYIPPYDNIEQIDFILYDGDESAGKAVYKISLQSPQIEGIINLSLPKISLPLEIDKLYQWGLKLTMKSQASTRRNPTPSQAEEIVRGWIQRKGLNKELSDRIKQSNPRQQAAIYAENGFWYDALSTLALLRRDFPQNLAVRQDWKTILKSVDLGELADKPFLK
jgi:hypothetical protein